MVVFLCAFAYLWWLAASRFVFFMNDEGIYLDGALRMFRGEMPYKDFFAITGPGSYALVAASFRAFGVTLMAARIPVMWDIAIITACLFWLASKLSDSSTAALAAFLYLPFATLADTAVVVNHRWDSAAWAILAGTLIVAAVENPAARFSTRVFVAGIAAGIAAWCTPPVALAAVALGACLLAYRSTRRLFVAYAGGVAAALALGLSWIVLRGALPAMIESFHWTAANYSGANRTWYGSVPGGYAGMLHGATPVGIAMTVAVLAFFTLPATLPPLSLLGLWKRPSKSIVILTALGAALLLSAHPRWDLNHLTWVAAPFYAMAASWIAGRSFRGAAGLRKGLALVVLLAAGSCLGQAIYARLQEVTRVTTMGTVHGRPQDLDVVANIQARVTPADTLFVYPYRPLLYFVTGAHNPTQYSFLQPGMFPDQDEQEALRQLRANPPRWILHARVSPEQLLVLWPSSDPRRLHMPSIEAFLGENYREMETWGDLQLLEERSAATVVTATAR